MLNLRHCKLVVWQREDNLFIKIHTLATKSFPSTERFELGAQIRRAAYSVAANIVEGVARRHQKDRLHFLNIAESSLAEVAYCIHAAWRLGYINDAVLADFEKELNGVGAPLAGLVRHTRASGAAIPLALLAAVLWCVALS